MSGVRAGSRLEQLEALSRRLQHEIAQERHRLALDARHAPAPVATRRPSGAPAAPDSRPPLPEDVSSLVIKQWGFREGLVDHVARGRISKALVEAYYDAHQPAGGPS